MNTRRRAFLLVLLGCLPGLAAGFAGGWFASRNNPLSSEPPARGAESRPEFAATPGAAAGKTGDPKPLGTAGTRTTALLESLKGSRGLASQLAILKHVSGLSLEELKAEAKKAETGGFPSDPNDGMLRNAVFARWAELDAEGLVESARRSGSDSYRFMGVYSGFQELGRRDPEKAWSLAAETGGMKNQAQHAILQGLAAEDPGRAFELARRDSGSYTGWALRSVMSSWVEKDPAAAAAAAASMKGTRNQQQAISGLMERWAALDYGAATAWASGLDAPQRAAAMTTALQSVAQTDPERALKLLDSTDIGGSRWEVVGQAMNSLALRDFDAALEKAVDFKNFRDKTAALSALAGAATEADRARLLALAADLPANVSKSIYESNLWQQAWSDPKALLQTVENIPHAAVREQAMRQAAGNLAYYDPEEGGKLFLKLQPSSQDPGTAQNIANNLANTDPQKAIQWAESLSTDALKKAALSGALQQWAAADPEAAGRQISKITNPETRVEVTRSVAQGLAGRSLAEAEKWAGGLSGADRSAALGVVAQRAATEDPDRARTMYAKFASSLSPEDAAKSENHAVARAVSSQLAQTDAAEAVAWTMALPEGGARDEAVSGVVATWASWDATGASEWVNTLPPGDGRDLAAGNLVKTIARDDPDSAWAWAGNIADPARRREAAAAALDGWKANNRRDEARAALDSGNFTDTERQELARRLE